MTDIVLRTIQREHGIIRITVTVEKINSLLVGSLSRSARINTLTAGGYTSADIEKIEAVVSLDT